MILVVDIGNTRVKAAVYEKDTLVDWFVFKNDFFLKEIGKILKIYPKIIEMVLSSVANLAVDALDSLTDKLKIHQINREAAFPFTNMYATPATLGIDRMVSTAGAVLQFPNQNRLVIDAGTCVTYDFVDCNNIYYGGAISPGVRLRYTSMHSYTAKLPLLSLEDIDVLIGDSTVTAMHSGVINGLCFEIDGYIDSLRAVHENFIIILTGGDANFLAKRLKNTIFANSNFLVESLNKLYQYQIGNV